jgi:hypothetical protein
MTVTINLSDDKALVLQARAAAEGLSLEEWFKTLATEAHEAAPGSLQAAANIVLEEMRNVPADMMAALPKDGASEHDHYLYGWPKRNS